MDEGKRQMCGSADVATGKTDVDAEEIRLLTIVLSHVSGPVNFAYRISSINSDTLIIRTPKF